MEKELIIDIKQESPKKLAFNIDSVEDYLDVGIDPAMVMKIVEETPLEKFKPVYVTSYFLVKQDRVSS